MKYPITPEYLTNAPDPLVKLFGDLEEYILKDICRRFKLSGEATESAIAQIKILQERGANLSEIEKEIRKTLNLSQKELEKIFDRAVERNRQYYDDLIKKSDIVSADYKGIEREVSIIQKQTNDEFVNLTQSLGFAIRMGKNVEFLPIASTYQKILDDTASQVFSGAFDYNTAIKTAVKSLTDSGLQMIDYASGWHNRADVAARRAVMTGVSQLSAQYAEQAAEVLKTDFREVTAHQGARDTGTGWKNHKNWQGKVYSIKAGDKYPSIYEVCGWGMVDGLEGANCRHHHFPFVDGVSERTYTDEQLANIDPPPFEYQGREYTAYEATQKQRQIETAMRKCKIESIAYKAVGLEEDAQNSAIKLNRLAKEYKSFSGASGLRIQPERSMVYGAPDILDTPKFKALINYNGEVSIVKKFSERQYAVKIASPKITGQTAHYLDNLANKSDRRLLTKEASQSIIDNSKLTLYQTDRETLKFLSESGYVVLNLDNQIVTAVPEKMRKKYRDFLEVD